MGIQPNACRGRLLTTTCRAACHIAVIPPKTGMADGMAPADVYDVGNQRLERLVHMVTVGAAGTGPCGGRNGISAVTEQSRRSLH